MTAKALVIAVDGPSGVGKTTVSRELASRLGLDYIDTGAMYRAVAVKVEEAGVDVDDDGALTKFLKTLDILFDGKEAKISVNGQDLSEKIRTPEAGVAASKTSSKSVLRRHLVALQKEMAASGGVVMEGRDIGTVVLTDADYKFFLTASHEVRAARRHKEFQGKTGSGPAASEVSKQIAERDKRDSTRKDSPLKAAADAITIDTGELDIEGVIVGMLSVIDAARGA